MYYPPASPEANLSIARVNWIHEHYKGKIDRDGMLYTLTVFVTEPAKYIAAYDWRPRTDLENEAAARFWHKIALKMGIADPPRSNADFCRVNADIEERRLRYDPKNREVAEAGMDLFLSRVPAPLRPLLRPALVAVLDDKLAAIMGLDPAAARPRSRRALTAGAPRVGRAAYDAAAQTRGGRAFRTDTTVVTYVRPTLWRRWGPAAWFAWLAGVSVVGDKGAYPEGCDVSELGPLYFVGKGKEDVAQRARELVDGNLRPPVWVD
ncbi:hypothetical protein DFJ73DRAFT_956101 [Zopfochytrium polystomum]|nr:hypothetical protein DFJ73DRAFT_956101 [Zopfochytrium polystomum]